MSQTPPTSSFDDPGLKAALCRAWGNETAPRLLRERVATAMHTASAAPEPGMALWRWRSPLYGLAAAAAVALAIGVEIHFAHRTTPSSNAPIVIAANVLPTSLARDLIQRHDECCDAVEHHGFDHHGVPGDDFAQVRRELHEKLGFPIMSANLPQGWKFHGGSVCPVGKFLSGHLVFIHDDRQFVSLLSVPPAFLDGTDQKGDCSQVTDNHPIAGFVTPDGFYCVVGSSTDGSLSVEQVRDLRNRLRPDVADADEDGDIILAISH